MEKIKALTAKDQELLQGLQTANRQAIEQVYDLALPAVILWVKENNGTEADARDIFQEALIALFQKLEAAPFEISCSLKSFIRIMCRNLWLSRLRNRKKFKYSPLTDIEAVELEEDVQQRIEQAEKTQLYFKHFDNLDGKCQKILQWFFDKVPLKEIAQRLDTSENYIKKRKFLCKEKLIEAIQNDALFVELNNYPSNDQLKQ